MVFIDKINLGKNLAYTHTEDLRIASRETLAKLTCEHRSTRAVSKGCRRIIARLFGLRINLLAANFAA